MPTQTITPDLRAEIEKNKAAMAALQADAEAARSALAKANQMRRDTKTRLRIVAVVMMVAALSKLAYQAATAPNPQPATQVHTAPLVTVPPPAQPKTVEAQFQFSLDRLRAAFHSFPELDQMEVVRLVNLKHPHACTLVWNAQGVPSLELVTDPPSAIAALNRCAEEIEILRRERGSESPRQP